MKYLVSIFLICFLTGNKAFSQSVVGTVSDIQSGEPLIGANLYLKSNWRKGTSTDLNGAFSISLDANDTLIVSYIGYQELEFPVTPKQKTLIIKLQSNIANMDEVVVSAEKLIAEEFTYKKIKRLDIYTNPSAKADPLLAINSLPSSTTLDESANISFRGSSPAETGIFMNNVPIYDAIRFSQLNGIGTFSIFNTAIVDNMQVFPGNPPLEFGNTTSGLIAIQTAEEVPEVSMNSATLSLASFGLMTSRPLGEKTGLTIFTNYQPSAIIRGLNSEALASIKKFRSNDVGINIVKKINTNSLLKIFNYSLYEGYDFQFTQPTYNGIFKQRKKRNFTITNWRTRIKRSEITVNGSLSFSNANFGYADTDISIHNMDGFVSANYQFIGNKFDLKSGLTYDFRKQKFDGTFYQYDYASGPGYPIDTQKSEAKLKRPEVYTYAKYYLGDHLIFGAGIRKNIPVKEQGHYLSGQINSRIIVNEQFSINAAWGKYHKYALPQNENSSTYLIESTQFSLDLEYKQDPLEITFSAFSKEDSQVNEKTNVIGAELFTKAKICKKLTVQTSITYIDATTQASDNTEYSGKYDLNYFIKGSLKYQITNLWDITTTFLSREGSYYQPLINTNYDENLAVYEPQFAPQVDQKRLPNYTLFDLSVSRLFPIKEKLTIITFASLSNIFNTKNVRGYSYNFDYSERSTELFSQRTVYFGAVINF